MIDIEQEKLARTTELRNAFEAVSVGIEATGKVSQEALEVAKVILDIRGKLNGLIKTPATMEFIDTVGRDLDSLKAAEKEQIDPKKRRRAISECLSRITRDMIQLGFPDLKLTEMVHVAIPAEK